MSDRRGFVVLLALFCCPYGQRIAIAQQTTAPKSAASPQEKPLAGYPIAAARRRAIATAQFHRPLDETTIKKWMDISSQCTIAEFELFLAPLSPQEAKLLAKIENMPPPIVNRLYFEHLRSVLKNGGLYSLTLEEKTLDKPFQHTTPAVENELFGAFECVFASVGPPNGSPRYGDVIIRMKDSVRETGWATPFSGMHFIYAIRHQPARKMQDLLASGKPLPTARTNPLSLGFDDRLSYSHYIVTEKYWHKALAYQAILVLRRLENTKSGDRATTLRGDAGRTGRGEILGFFIPAREKGLSAQEEAARVPFGYLEAKFPNELSMDFVTSIEVSPEQLAEVRTWPEAKPYLSRIRVKPNGVE